MSITSIDEVVRGICGTENRSRFRELSDAIIRDLDIEQIEALVAAYRLDGERGAKALLAVWLRGERRWVRLRPSTKRLTHVIDGATFRAGQWYSVSLELSERLRDEPANDMGRFVALFEVETQAPTLAADVEVAFIW